MKDEESSQAAELDSDHRDANPSLCAGFGGFIIAHQPAMTHQPAEGAFDHPTARQNFESLGGVGAFDDLDGQFGAQPLL